MPTILVPNAVTATRASVLVCHVDVSPGDLDNTRLFVGNAERKLGEWKRWRSSDGRVRVHYQRLTVNGLQPGSLYELQCTVGNSAVRATTRTLPDQLPSIDSDGFTVLLGSCFYARNDPSGAAGLTFSNLPRRDRPTLKVLCGDQVYLDAPWYKFLWPRSLEWLEEDFLGRYLGTFRQQAEGGAGFLYLLSNGANYFSSDDHEFWNNAPFPGAYVANSWAPGPRRAWRELATQLFRIFQAPSHPEIVNVGGVSFFIADTRVDRDDQRRQFMDAAQFQSLSAWIAALKGPGVLVIGQPLFADKAGFVGHLTDWNLPDYAQYEDLVRAVASTKHDLLLLTGDVHFGRIASCMLASGAELIEIISSPLALVDKNVGGKWNASPSQFPPFPIPGVTKMPVRTERGYTMTDNHFLTLTFHAIGPRVRVTVKAWPIREGEFAEGRLIFQPTID